MTESIDSLLIWEILRRPGAVVSAKKRRPNTQRYVIFQSFSPENHQKTIGLLMNDCIFHAHCGRFAHKLVFWNRKCIKIDDFRSNLSELVTVLRTAPLCEMCQRSDLMLICRQIGYFLQYLTLQKGSGSKLAARRSNGQPLAT